MNTLPFELLQILLIYKFEKQYKSPLEKVRALSN